MVRDPTYEYLYVHTPDAVFAISPAHAAVDFPNSPVLALQYAHLDLFFIEMVDPTRFTGILPQLWGVIPKSPEVVAMLEPPAPAGNTSLPSCPNGAADRGHAGTQEWRRLGCRAN